MITVNLRISESGFQQNHSNGMIPGLIWDDPSRIKDPLLGVDIEN
jgi:hypothetical protein